MDTQGSVTPYIPCYYTAIFSGWPHQSEASVKRWQQQNRSGAFCFLSGARAAAGAERRFTDNRNGDAGGGEGAAQQTRGTMGHGVG